MAREALLLSGELHILAERLPPRTSVLVSGNVQGVGCLNHAGNGSAIPSLYCPHECRQAVEVGVVDIDVTTRADQVELVEHHPQMTGELVITKQPTDFTGGRVCIRHHGTSVTPGRLKGTKAESLQPKGELWPPLGWHTGEQIVLNERTAI